MYDYSAIRIGIGVMVLLVVVLLPTKADSGRRYPLFGLLAGAVLAFCLLALVVHYGHLVVDNDDDEGVKAEIDHVRSSLSAGLPVKNLFIPDGSSQTQLGLDPSIVQDELKKQGYDAVVIEFAEGGADTLERYTLLQRFTDEMRRHDLPYSPNTRLLMELHPYYEMDPVRFFGANSHALRAYFYSSPSNVRRAIHVYNLRGVEPDKNKDQVFDEMYLHYLAWKLDIGFLPMLRRFDGLPGKAFYAPSVRTRGVGEWWHRSPNWVVKATTRTDLLVPMSVTMDRAGQFSGLFPNGSLTGVSFYLMTSRDEKLMKHGVAFCRIRRGHEQTCIDGADPMLLAQLDGPDYYYDVDHLSTSAAAIYSRYFADQLVAQGMVTK